MWARYATLISIYIYIPSGIRRKCGVLMCTPKRHGHRIFVRRRRRFTKWNTLAARSWTYNGNHCFCPQRRRLFDRSIDYYYSTMAVCWMVFVLCVFAHPYLYAIHGCACVPIRSRCVDRSGWAAAGTRPAQGNNKKWSPSSAHTFNTHFIRINLSFMLPATPFVLPVVTTNGLCIRRLPNTLCGSRCRAKGGNRTKYVLNRRVSAKRNWAIRGYLIHI